MLLCNSKLSFRGELMAMVFSREVLFNTSSKVAKMNLASLMSLGMKESLKMLKVRFN